jgi:uncharacterized protein
VASVVAATQEIAAGYATRGAAVDLGAVVLEGDVDRQAPVRLPLATFNRHGLVAGATGTGKTKTLQLLTEQLSRAGVPVFLADVKGDLSGLNAPGPGGDQISTRASEVGEEWQPAACPVQFLSLGGGGVGVPIRATVDGFGPVLLSKVLGLNETQESTLGLIVDWARRHDLPLVGIHDLRSVIQYLTSDSGKAELQGIGGVSAATAGVILRKLSNLDAQGGVEFFGEPACDVGDLIRTVDGQGVVSLLEVDDLQTRPVLFSTFLMWLLAELFERLPEAGDLDRPKLVFFFDEAHLLFEGASKAFLERIEQTVKLIRSKGVGVFFCTQLPTDVPDAVLSQLGARIQHAVRAFTPQDQQALARTVKTYPKTEYYRLDQALTTLGIGEAIVTVLSEKGTPTPVAWTRLRPPQSLMGSVGVNAIRDAAAHCDLHDKYQQTVDRESAADRLAKQTPAEPAGSERGEPPRPRGGEHRKDAEKRGVLQKAMANPAVRSFMRSAASALGREASRNLFGKGRR